MPKKYGKILLAALILALFVAAELKQKAGFGWSFDFILAALMVLPLFLDTAEFLLFGAFSFWLLKLIFPWSGTETILLAAFPLAAFLFQKLFPWQFWLEPFIAVFIGLFGFYGLLAPAKFFGNLGFLFLDFSVLAIFAWAMYVLMALFAKQRT